MLKFVYANGLEERTRSGSPYSRLKQVTDVVKVSADGRAARPVHIPPGLCGCECQANADGAIQTSELLYLRRVY